MLLSGVAWPVLAQDGAAVSNSGTMCSPGAGSLFANKRNDDFYWKALMYLAKNNRELATKIVAALKANDQTALAALHLSDTTGSIDECFDHLFVTFMSRDPQALSGLGLFESIGIREHNAYLTNVSPAAIMQAYNDKKASLSRLESYAFNDLSADQKISYRIFHWMLKHTAEGEPFLFHEYKINQMFGILADLTMVFTQFHQLEVPEDVENYIVRLGRIPEQIQQTIALLEYQKTQGILPPMFAIPKVITRIENLTPASVVDCLFYTHLAANIEKIKMTDTAAWLTRALTVIQMQVYPALEQLREYCTQLLATVNTNHGVWALPSGDAYYDYMLKQHTTTNLSADEIHVLGLKEVAKIQQEMRTILAREGIVDDSKTVGALVQELAQDDRFYYPESEEGRAQCLAQYNAILERCRKELYALFDLKPKTPVRIQAVPKQEEEGQPGAYYLPPSIDGSRPGIFFANLRNMREVPTYEMETLVMHEAEPGHHFQIALQQESDMPLLRKLGDYTAYVEGWALYAEKLAYEHGFYATSFDQLGHLSDELLRAVRLVVDTGIHRKRWTREQAIEYMVCVTGMHRDSVVTEIERYFVYPGQACAYKIGQLKILELRDRAKKALGVKFDIRQFHNVVLKLGAAPLTVLEEVVDQYIQDTLANT
jgi:uncharacterized protein (DUF885 family)